MTDHLDDLTIVVDETHEEPRCTIHVNGDEEDCPRVAVIAFAFSCGCHGGSCQAHIDYLRKMLRVTKWFRLIGGGVFCRIHGRRVTITRTWPVTR